MAERTGEYMKNGEPRRMMAIALLLYLLMPLWLSGQGLRGLTLADGLSDLVVNDIYKDRQGYVWLGTGTSLDRFDGVRVRQYPIPGSNAALKRVNAICEGPDGDIYVGNGEGLLRLASDSLLRVEPKKINLRVNSLLPVAADTLLVGTDRGLYVYVAGRGVVRHVLPSDRDIFSQSNVINCIIPDGNGALWFASTSALMRYDIAGNSVTTYAYTIDGCAFTDIAMIGEQIYVGTASCGLLRFDTTSHTFHNYLDVGCNVVSSLSGDGKDMLYVATDGNGVAFISVSQNAITQLFKRNIGGGNALRSNSVYSLLVDREGLMWVGYYKAGADYTLFQRELFKVYRSPLLDTAGKSVRSLIVDGTAKLVGTREGLYYIDESTGTCVSLQSPEIRSNIIFCIHPYHGEYLIGTFGGGMYVFNPTTHRLRDFDPMEQTLTTGDIFCMAVDHTGTLWIGTSAGVYHYRGDQRVARYTSSNSKLPPGNVYEIFFDSAKRGWICTEGGMALWAGSTFYADGFPADFINSEKVRVVYEDSDHTLYFFPDKGRIVTADLTLSEISTLDLPTGGVPGAGFIVEAPDRSLWIGSDLGLWRYDRGTGLLRGFNFADGIPSPVFTLCEPVIDTDGTLWLGNTNGLLSLDFDQLKEYQLVNYRPAITDVTVGGISIISQATAAGKEEGEGSLRLSLGSGSSGMRICFSDFSYTEPHDMNYEYRLDGGDDSPWTALYGRSEISYFDIAPGRHRFTVRRAGQPGSETTIVIDIARAINYSTLLLTVLIVVMAGIAVYYYIKHRHHEDERREAAASKAAAPLAAKPEKYRNSHLSDEECRRLFKLLEKAMTEKRSYTNPNLKSTDLAAEIGTTSYALSFIFNQYLKKSYYDYVNEYRVREFERMVTSGTASRYTLSAISARCGFSSRTSFFRHFKKMKGITPAEYIKSQQK